LLEDASQNGAGQIKAVVARDRDSQVGLYRVAKLCMAPRLMVNVETGPQKRSKDDPRLEKRELRAYLGAQGNTQSRSVRVSLVRDLLP
jgi:hypothetical protein